VTSLEGFADGVLDLFLPKRCVQCGRAGRWLCEACAPALVRLPPTVCRRCGAPLTHDAPVCAECRGRDLAFVSARAAFVYAGPARRLVTACKFRSLKSLAAEMASLAAAPFGEAVAAVARVAPGDGALGARGGGGIDVVTCVPVHPDRDLERGFDQAALLGRRLAAAAGLSFAPLLVRARKGRRQSGLGAADRAANVADAFRLDERMADKAGRVKIVLVVDDVYTTGETLHQCCRVLRHAGCEPHAFTFARAARGFRLPIGAER
jgi:ComF family protein